MKAITPCNVPRHRHTAYFSIYTYLTITVLSAIFTHEVRSLPEDKTVAQNRKARHEYFIVESFETGIVLSGTEIKSVREGHTNLKDGFARVENGELWLYNVHISPYDKGS